jgi:hypothetical protein
MELQIKIIGGLFILLAFIHIPLPKYFKWKEDLATVALINRQLMYVHMSFIALGIFLVGVLCLTSAGELLGTAFGRRVCLGLAIFWITRLYAQFFVFSKGIWKGKAFETAVHIVFSFFWAYLSIIFMLGYLKDHINWV